MHIRQAMWTSALLAALVLSGGLGVADIGKAAGWILDADRIEGLEVKANDGKPVGEIERVVVNAETGRIAYVVVDPDGVVGAQGEEIVLPWNAVEIRRSGNEWEGFVASVDSERMTKAPTFRDLQDGKASPERVGNFYERHFNQEELEHQF